MRPGERPFPHVAQVARVDRRREFADGKIESETVFALTSRASDELGELGELALGRRSKATGALRMRSTTAATALTTKIAAKSATVRARKCRRQRDRTLPQMPSKASFKVIGGMHLSVPIFLTIFCSYIYEILKKNGDRKIEATRITDQHELYSS